jgi:hypothetical protein
VRCHSASATAVLEKELLLPARKQGPAWWIWPAGEAAGRGGGVVAAGAPRRRWRSSQAGRSAAARRRRPRQVKAKVTGAPRAGRWREISATGPAHLRFLRIRHRGDARDTSRDLRQILAGGGAPMAVYCKLIQSSLLFLFTDCSCLSQSFTERQSKTEAKNEGLLSSFQSELDHSLGVLHKTVVG